MNPSHSAAGAYREEAIATAPPIKLVRLMYQGAIRCLVRATECDPKDPRSPFIHQLSSADAIVTELRVCLRPEHAPEVAARLEQLYLFVEDQIQAAMRERAVEPLQGALRVLTTLLDAWSRVEVQESAPVAAPEGA